MGKDFRKTEHDSINSIYDLDNFDSDKTYERKSRPEKTESATPDYGDNFNSQTGDDNEGYLYEDEHNIYSHSDTYDKKKIYNTTVIVLVVIAVVCVIGAMVFALTQCTDGSSPLKHTTTPSTSGTEFTLEGTTQVATQAIATEAVTTEAITEAQTVATTQAPTTFPETTQALTTAEASTVVTEPPTAETTTSPFVQNDIEENGDVNEDDY